MKYAPSGWNGMLTVAFFDLTRENFVQYDPDTFVQIQTGETTSTGLELEATAGLRSGLDLMASLAYNDVEITESANPAEVGERPTQTPEVTASAWLDYTVLSGALEGLGLAAGARHVGATFGDIPNTLEVPSVTLVDAALQYDWRSFGLQVNAHNLFDERYTAAAFRRSSPLATFGPTRTLSASLHYRW